MPSKVRDRDRGYKALKARLLGKAKKVTVGIHEDVGEEIHPGGGALSTVTIAEVGSFHEFGLGVPRRSFIADWADENEDAHREQLRKIGRAVVTGQIESVEQGLDRFGVHAVGEVQQRIRAGIEPQLAESTVEEKGSSTPLIDTGVLWGSIRHKVEDGEK